MLPEIAGVKGWGMCSPGDRRGEGMKGDEPSLRTLGSFGPCCYGYTGLGVLHMSLLS